ncbi:hypothetical protein K469DRAFT_709186 [Zopfia rhizophila CBS 207.26]|uniref:HNH nuclease domain-containing protein n=1 Tax=Zopfia rhizophila CBS 207.26 TaxID=1314779 RepID=A0A6A6E0C8_9PEZI|nr:hypothetical protein K469DRAFT_709186 [Zopfia rhizophila CBS 207.26]
MASIELLQALNDALPANTIRPTTWACLWLYDINKLVDLLALAQTMPTATLFIFGGTEVLIRIVLIFEDTLRMFWSKERVDAWYNAIFPFSTEVSYFTLKPIRMSDDKKRLDVQFFWLSLNPYVPEVNVLQVPSLPANLDQGPNLAKLFNHETDTKIHSGCEISFETDDPFLHRVTAMSGAAEPQDDFHDDDSDDDIVEALQNRWDMYTEDDWDMDIEEGPATSPERFWKGRFPAQLPGIQTFGHMVTLRGGEDREGEDRKEF